MAKNDNLKDFLTDVANAIREKKGTTDLINPQNFSEEILSIESGDSSINAILDRTIVEYENDSIEELGDYAFQGCTSLTTLRLPNLKRMRDMVVAGARALHTLEAPLLQTIGTQSLRDNKFVTLDLPSLTSISTYALYGCSLLTTFILRNNIVCSLANANAFGGTPIANGTGYIYVPADLVDAYKSATNWSTYADQIKSLDELPA